MSINFCEVGNVFPSTHTRKLPYLSRNTFLDYDAVILSMDSHGMFANNNGHSSKKDLYDKRKSDLEEFIIHKKIPLIVFAPSPQKVYFQGIGDFDLDYFLPVGKFIVENEIGVNTEVIPKTVFSDFLKKYQSKFSYNSYFHHYEGVPILKTPHTNKVLAYYNEKAVFLPTLKDKTELDEFFSDLYKTAIQVRSKSLKVELPDWSKSYFLPTEKKARSEIISLESQIEELSRAVVEKKDYVLQLEFRKQILTGSGNVLEEEIKKMFQELGFTILESELSRDDITVSYNDKIAVIEIKGVNGSSGEGHATQLEKWVALSYEKYNKHPKGILIVNSFKEKKLSERSEPTFPDQMLKYSVGREHCLISTLQFLGLYYMAIDSSEKEELINSLFDTVGIYKGFEDWSKFIET